MKMQTFRKPHQWLNFWLEKYAEVLSGLKFSGEQKKQYWATLKQFLEELPGNPRNIPLESVRNFVEKDLDSRLPPISLFFQHIAPSKPHLEMLKRAAVPEEPEGAESDELVGRFRLELSKKEFSPRTVKNYCTAVSSFLRWFSGVPSEINSEAIDGYRDYLETGKKLSPRTVALHISALKLFYQGIVSGTSGDSPA